MKGGMLVLAGEVADVNAQLAGDVGTARDGQIVVVRTRAKMGG